MRPVAVVEPWRALVERVIAEYRATLADDLLSVAVFGSVARGQAGPGSDLDLYCVTRDQLPIFDPRIAAHRERVRSSTEYQALAAQGYRADLAPVFHSVDELVRHPWILLDISHHGIVLFDPDGVLGRELDAVRKRLEALGARRVERQDGTWYWDLKPDWRPGEVIRL